jgi:hypothetical protein
LVRTGFEHSLPRGFQNCAHFFQSTNIRREAICWLG